MRSCASIPTPRAGRGFGYGTASKVIGSSASSRTTLHLAAPSTFGGRFARRSAFHLPYGSARTKPANASSSTAQEAAESELAAAHAELERLRKKR